MKNDRKTVIAIVLVLLAIGVVAYQFLRTAGPMTAALSPETASDKAPQASGAQQQKSGGQAAEAAEEVTPYGSYIATIRETDIAFNDPKLRNPMTPLVKDPKEAAALSKLGDEEIVGGEINALSVGYSIEGIVWNQTRPLALVNNQVVTVGEKLDDGSLITEITPDKVKFTKDGKNYFLVFKEDR
jgi:hypothetical protein